MLRWKNFFRDRGHVVETLAQARADRFRIETKLGRDFGVTQISVITQFDNFTAGPAQLIERAAHKLAGLGLL